MNLDREIVMALDKEIVWIISESKVLLLDPCNTTRRENL